MHFLHTPFAAPAMLGVLPDDVAAELLDGMAGYVACGFHCHKWEAGFLGVLCGGRARPAPPTFVAPLGPDDGVLEAEAASAECAAAADALRAEVGGRRIIARTDRMEPSKNIVRGMLAFEELLARTPSGAARWCTWPSRIPRGRGWPSISPTGPTWCTRPSGSTTRSGSESDGWTPIVLSRRGRPGPLAGRADLVRRLVGQPGARRAEPGGQGGPAAQPADGVLVLSHEAGAWEELELGGGGALGVNPFDVTGTAEALHAALSMGAARTRRAGGGAARGGARRGRRPTGGPTSWRRLRR